MDAGLSTPHLLSQLKLHEQIRLEHHVAAIPGNWPLLGCARNIAGGKPTVQIFSQRFRVVEREHTGQEIGEVVGRVKLPTLRIQVAQSEVRAVDVWIDRTNSHLSIIYGDGKVARFLILSVSQTDQPSQIIRETWTPTIAETWGRRIAHVEVVRKQGTIVLIEPVIAQGVVSDIPVQGERFFEQFVRDVARGQQDEEITLANRERLGVI